MVLVVCLKPCLVTKPVQKAFSVLGSIIRLMVLVVAFSPIGLFFPMPMVDINTHPSSLVRLCASFKTTRTWSARGTLSSLPIFMAFLGMVIKAASKSIYSHFIRRMFLGLRKTNGIGFNASRSNDQKVCPEYKTNVDLVGEIHCIHASDRLYHESYIVQ